MSNYTVETNAPLATAARIAGQVTRHASASQGGSLGTEIYLRGGDAKAVDVVLRALGYKTRLTRA